MDAIAARTFDRTRNFSDYIKTDLVGAAYWCARVLEGASSRCPSVAKPMEWLADVPSKDKEPELRKALVVGDASLPSRIRIDEPKNKPNSGTVNF